MLQQQQKHNEELVSKSKKYKKTLKLCPTDSFDRKIEDKVNLNWILHSKCYAFAPT